jgi:cob(I)alamin adenosyltransferase
MRKGLIQVYTGDGKGKTTAAFGLAIRAAGQGLRVRIYQFLKGGSPISGELIGLQKCSLSVYWKRYSDQIPPMFQGEEPDETALKKSLKLALEEVRTEMGLGELDLVVLDEINVALGQGWIPLEGVLSLLIERPPGVEVVLTGRGAPQALLEQADLVTDMRAVKHPYDKGLAARRGIEF